MESLKKEVMRKGIVRVVREKAERFRQARENGYLLQAYLAKVEHQQSLALVVN